MMVWNGLPGSMPTAGGRCQSSGCSRRCCFRRSIQSAPRRSLMDEVNYNLLYRRLPGSGLIEFE
jgi:hypothetical protein